MQTCNPMYKKFTTFNKNYCNNCEDNGNIVEDFQQGNKVCTNCGIVQESRIIHDGPDWSNYQDTIEAGKDNSRVSWTDPSNFYSTLGSTIKKNTFITCRDENGKLVKRDLSRIHQIVSSDNKERAFYEVIKIFDKITYDGSLAKRTVDKAKIYWNEFVKHGRIFRGGNRKGILACCILYASYATNCSKTRNQVAEFMLITKEDIIKGEPIFHDIIGKSNFRNILKHNNKSLTERFMPAIEKLGLPFHYNKKCNDLYHTCEEELSEISSSAAIGGVISFILHTQEKNKKPTKKTLTAVVGITNPTLTNAIKIIKEKIDNV